MNTSEYINFYSKRIYRGTNKIKLDKYCKSHNLPNNTQFITKYQASILGRSIAEESQGVKIIYKYFVNKSTKKRVSDQYAQDNIEYVEAVFDTTTVYPIDYIN